MDKRLRDVIDSIDYHELLKMKKDLGSGGYHLKRFINSELKKREKMHEVYCSVCGNLIDSSSSNSRTLIFGSDDFKKKATFCGNDCLRYFLKNLDDMNSKKQETRI